ncbi:hypothetical protein Leryth_019815 [Lithospermum erythrorhizon]|nr:hypothetical protein Leryth_019815 [Lithospermum erythrorhizon]
MLALPPLRNISNERTNEMGSFSIMEGEDFPDFSASTECNLLDSIDLDELFDVGINEGDVLPDLEMDPEILADFSLSGSEDSDFNFCSENHSRQEEEVFVDINKHSGSDHGENNNNVGSKLSGNNLLNPSPKEAADKGKKASNNSTKNAQSKRKVKVDWTPELHRRFVQAVEQLGVDKAVPSRILELMGIQGLTRHNIASHLQKYRSHRKHMQAREAEAANWNQRRQVYSGSPPATNGGKRDAIITPWVAPTIGFPPPPHFRPLHVWGHPSVDQSLLHMWPKHIASSPPSWPPLQTSPSFWHSHHQHGFQRYSTPPISGIPAATMYKVDPGIGFPVASIGQTLPKPPLDVQPTKESIDAALGDVLAKPWLPLPLGLRAPSIDSVLGALQREGVSKVPPTTCAS